MKIEKSCGCIVLKDDEMLIIGAKDDEGELFWSFPKGHQEIGETDIETAIRETKEETGLTVKIIDSNPIITGHPMRNGTAYKDIRLFITKPLTKEFSVQEDEVEQIKWIHITEADKYLKSYYNYAWRKLLERLHKA